MFTSMSSTKMARLIRDATARVVLCVPAVAETVVAAIVTTNNRLGRNSMRIVLDCDEEVFRLGYGYVQAVATIRKTCDVRQCAGLRIGVLVCDDTAWVFAPTALYVQPEVHSDETPNAVMFHGDAAANLAAALVPQASPIGEGHVEAEIGNMPLDRQVLERVVESLTVAPPIPFNISRQVRVFQPYIQYVDLSLRGCSIQRRRATIPRSIQEFGATGEIARRLNTTFDLIEQGGGLSSQTLDDELKKIRDSFTKALPKPWGRVLLRNKRPLFDQRISEFRKKLEQHKSDVKADLKKKLDESRRQLVQHYLPIVKDNPPDRLVGQLIATKPKEDDIRNWLDRALADVFPTPEQLISEMIFDVQFRDVTFETLNEPLFAAALKDAFPLVDWDKPFDEFTAAKEQDHSDSCKQPTDLG